MTHDLLTLLDGGTRTGCNALPVLLPRLCLLQPICQTSPSLPTGTPLFFVQLILMKAARQLFSGLVLLCRHPEQCPREMAQLVEVCLHPIPDRRPTAKQIIAAISHMPNTL